MLWKVIRKQQLTGQVQRLAWPVGRATTKVLPLLCEKNIGATINVTVNIQQAMVVCGVV
jgi:hypothetical protein